MGQKNNITSNFKKTISIKPSNFPKENNNRETKTNKSKIVKAKMSCNITKSPHNLQDIKNPNNKSINTTNSESRIKKKKKKKSTKLELGLSFFSLTTSETATTGEDRQRVLDLEREGRRNRDPRNLEVDLKGSNKRGLSLDLVELRGRGWRILSDEEKDIVCEKEEGSKWEKGEMGK